MQLLGIMCDYLFLLLINCAVTTLGVLTHGSSQSSATLQDFLFSGNAQFSGASGGGGRNIILGTERHSDRPWRKPNSDGFIKGSNSYKGFPSYPYNNKFISRPNLGHRHASGQEPHRWSPLFHVISSHLPYDEIAFSVDSDLHSDNDFPIEEPLSTGSYHNTAPYSSHKYKSSSFAWPGIHGISKRPSSTTPAPTAAKVKGNDLPVDAPQAQHFVCPDQHSCSDQVWVTSDTSDSLSWRERGCLCDSQCRRYGDCCRDASILSANISTNKTKNASVGENNNRNYDTVAGAIGTKLVVEPEHFVCQSVPSISGPKESKTKSSQLPLASDSFYIRQSCPPRYDSYYGRLNCERPPPSESDPLASVPATSNITGVTYRNVFCALCHNDTSQLVVWPVSVHCTGLRPFQLLSGHLDTSIRRIAASNSWGVVTRSGHVTPCSLVPRPPRQPSPRTCVQMESPRCVPGTPVTLIKLCYNHTALVYSNGQSFKNIYCLLCSGYRNQAPTSSVPTCQPVCSATGVPFARGGLRARIKFPIGNDSRCGDFELWDPFSQQCRSVVCSRPGDRFSGERCVPADELEKQKIHSSTNDSTTPSNSNAVPAVSRGDSGAARMTDTKENKLMEDVEVFRESGLSENSTDDGSTMSEMKDVSSETIETSDSPSDMLVESSGSGDL